jgi:hypothetical protein
MSRQNQPISNGNQQSPSQLYHQNSQQHMDLFNKHQGHQEQPQEHAAMRIQELVRTQALRLLNSTDQYRPYHHMSQSGGANQFLSELHHP